MKQDLYIKRECEVDDEAFTLCGRNCQHISRFPMPFPRPPKKVTALYHCHLFNKPLNHLEDRKRAYRCQACIDAVYTYNIANRSGVLDDIARIAQSITEDEWSKLPSDLAHNLHGYLYGDERNTNEDQRDA